MLRRILLACGALSSLLYIGIDVVAAIAHPEYHSFTSRMVSENMASGAPTERLVDPLYLLYGVLFLAFAAGVWMSGRTRRLRVTAGLMVAYAAVGFLGPIVGEMNLRGAGPIGAADLRHIALTGALTLLTIGFIATGAATLGRAFRWYSYATLVALAGSGVLVWWASQPLARHEPTPWLGTTERLLLASFLAWIAVYAIALARAPVTRPVLLRRPVVWPPSLPAR